MVVVTQLLGGWIFASGFRRTALRVSEPDRDYGVWVRALNRETITLEAIGPRQDIGHPGTLGLFWGEGYGHLGEVTTVDGSRVTRAFTILEGQKPQPCEAQALADCPPVDIEGYAYPNDPSDRDLAFSTVEYSSPLGSFPAWVVEAGSGARWAIHIHGWTAEKREAIRLLPSFQRAGVTSMAIDYRNDPGSPMDPSGHYRFGLTEWEDVEAAVGYAVSHGAKEVVLVGYSTGAAHALSFLENSEMADAVVGMVFDSPNIILADVVRANTVDARFPVINIPMGQLMRELGLVLADWRWKVDWEKTNYVQRSSGIIKCPTFVIHGTSDKRVPIDVSRQLEARVPDLVTLVETPAAGHVMSWNANPERYENRLEAYLRSI